MCLDFAVFLISLSLCPCAFAFAHSIMSHIRTPHCTRIAADAAAAAAAVSLSPAAPSKQLISPVKCPSSLTADCLAEAGAENDEHVSRSAG
ncbi:hypothetical protein WR25_13297 [Diploscapter pachys]|uniref:C2H2-type domain-containing protein n=1 Tax=Diploscapter pachys TaxID=2018661 RepID=A0A2A2JRQ6_9BILA|nr:hypothetical protein WR25_13297 [Diploscapter pachys]